MQFKKWAESERGRAGALAVYLKVPPSFVSKMVSGEKSIPVSHGAGIEAFSAGQVTRQEMFPDDWARIWPELVDIHSDAQGAAHHDAQPIETAESRFLKLADGLTLTDRRTGPADRRITQQPFTAPDRRVGPADRRGFVLPEVAAALVKGV